MDLLYTKDQKLRIEGLKLVSSGNTPNGLVGKTTFDSDDTAGQEDDAKAIGARPSILTIRDLLLAFLVNDLRGPFAGRIAFF